jgi:hypothetical protein
MSSEGDVVPLSPVVARLTAIFQFQRQRPRSNAAAARRGTE